MEPIGALARKVVDANLLKDMVGPCGLEPQTSTVSIDFVTPKADPELRKNPMLLLCRGLLRARSRFPEIVGNIGKRE